MRVAFQRPEFVNPGLTRPDGTSQSLDRVKSGKHHWLGPESNQKRIDDKSHNLLTRPDGTSLGREVQLNKVLEGRHHWVGVPPWRHERRTPLSLRTWYYADKIKELYDQGLGYRKIYFKLLDQYGLGKVQSVCDKLSTGWDPFKDVDWLSFKSENLLQLIN